MIGKLSIVATPIGNLEDITLRAIRVLGECEYMLCEDTRVTGKLMKAHGIEAKLRRYDAHTSDRDHEQILEDLSNGKHIALVSDAGTPGVSDPGVFLVAKIREAQTVGHPMSNSLREVVIEAIPGPSAVTAAFSIAGIPGNQFVFLGFVPQKKGRETFFKSLDSYDMPVIFFESTHRIMKTLKSLTTIKLLDIRCPTVTVARELTKMHEEVVKGSPKEVLNYFEIDPVKQKGEFVLLLENKGS